jgi:choline-sulfatase
MHHEPAAPPASALPSFALRALAALLLVGSFGCRGGEAGDGAPGKPPAAPANILLLVIDCLRGDGVGVNGYERPTTPHLDALAAEGTSFRQAFAQASWTRPSLPTILTGLYPSEHGLMDLGEDEGAHVQALDESIETFPERLAAAGYATAMFGEQHKLAPRFGLGQGFEVWHHRSGGAPNINRKAADWAAGVGERRFFAYLHYLEPHWPYCPPREVRGRFDDGGGFDVCADWRGLRRQLNEEGRVLDEAQRRTMRARYDEELLALDAELGKLFADLEARGLWDETLVIVTADHGEEFFEHGGWFHGQSLHDELVHVPLLVKPPASWGAPRGQVLDGLVESRDISATALAAAGVTALPPGTVDLLPWVRGERGEDAPRPFVVSEAVDKVALRTATAKLIVDRQGDRQQLYDLAADPGELNDLGPSAPPQLATLRREMAGWKRTLQPPRHGKVVEVDDETRQGFEALGYINLDKPSAAPTASAAPPVDDDPQRDPMPPE